MRTLNGPSSCFRRDTANHLPWCADGRWVKLFLTFMPPHLSQTNELALEHCRIPLMRTILLSNWAWFILRPGQINQVRLTRTFLFLLLVEGYSKGSICGVGQNVIALELNYLSSSLCLERWHIRYLLRFHTSRKWPLNTTWCFYRAPFDPNFGLFSQNGFLSQSAQANLSYCGFSKSVNWLQLYTIVYTILFRSATGKEMTSGVKKFMSLCFNAGVQHIHSDAKSNIRFPIRYFVIHSFVCHLENESYNPVFFIEWRGSCTRLNYRKFERFHQNTLNVHWNIITSNGDTKKVFTGQRQEGCF